VTTPLTNTWRSEAQESVDIAEEEALEGRGYGERERGSRRQKQERGRIGGRRGRNAEGVRMLKPGRKGGLAVQRGGGEGEWHWCRGGLGRGCQERRRAAEGGLDGAQVM